MSTVQPGSGLQPPLGLGIRTRPPGVEQLLCIWTSSAQHIFNLFIYYVCHLLEIFFNQLIFKFNILKIKFSVKFLFWTGSCL